MASRATWLWVLPLLMAACGGDTAVAVDGAADADTQVAEPGSGGLVGVPVRRDGACLGGPGS